MTREELLREFIVEKYGSINSFCMENDISPSTMSSIFKRGLGGASGDLILKICKILNISADKLLGDNKIERRTMDIHEVTRFDLELLTSYYEKDEVREAINILLGLKPLPPKEITDEK